MKTLSLHFLNILFCFVLFSCNRTKEETICTQANTILVPQDLKDRFFFKEGTYWIYQNLKTNETDSIWVFTSFANSVSVDNEDYGFIKDKCYETFGSAYKSIKFNSLPRYSSVSVNIYPKSVINNGELFGLEESTPLNYYTAIYRLEMRGDKYENQDAVEITKLDSLTTDANLVFKDVLRLKYPTGFKTFDYLDNMHYAKNIGLVKFYRFTDSSNWELIRYKIVQ